MRIKTELGQSNGKIKRAGEGRSPMPFKDWREINELIINDNQFLYPDCETSSTTSP